MRNYHSNNLSSADLLDHYQKCAAEAEAQERKLRQELMREKFLLRKASGFVDPHKEREEKMLEATRRAWQEAEVQEAKALRAEADIDGLSHLKPSNGLFWNSPKTESKSERDTTSKPTPNLDPWRNMPKTCTKCHFSPLEPKMFCPKCLQLISRTTKQLTLGTPEMDQFIRDHNDTIMPHPNLTEMPYRERKGGRYWNVNLKDPKHSEQKKEVENERSRPENNYVPYR